MINGRSLGQVRVVYWKTKPFMASGGVFRLLRGQLLLIAAEALPFLLQWGGQLGLPAHLPPGPPGVQWGCHSGAVFLLSGEVACLSLGGQIHRLPPPPPPPSPTHTHTNTHAAFLSEFLISLQGRIQDFGEEGVGSTWIIDASTTGRGARESRENFCGAFSTELRQSIVPSVRAAR